MGVFNGKERMIVFKDYIVLIVFDFVDLSISLIMIEFDVIKMEDLFDFIGDVVVMFMYFMWFDGEIVFKVLFVFE